MTTSTIDAINASGLKTKLYKSAGKDEVYCLVGAPEIRLKGEAARTDYELQLDDKEVGHS